MIPQLTHTFQLTQAEQALVDALMPFDGRSWTNGSVKPVKAEILRQLLGHQHRHCCYCGLTVNETGRGELDHIAKKGGPIRPAYVQYVFTPHNLAVSCQYCNSSSKKGQLDIFDRIDNTVYENCTFRIVHPYFDDPDQHYAWTSAQMQLIIRGISAKGLASIALFELDLEAHTSARARQMDWERRERRYQFQQSVITRIRNIVTFRR